MPHRSLDLRLPVIASPMFLLSGRDLVIAQCKAGVLGSFPALNARSPADFRTMLEQITSALAEHDRLHPHRPAAPFAVNHIVHPSNRWMDDAVALCAEFAVPVMITSLQSPERVTTVAKTYGAMVFHDVVNTRHAEKALEAGVDGLVAVCAGAGGHTGSLSPFALVTAIRRFFDGPLAVSGAISTGQGILATQAMGADYAYMGTRFIATAEANALGAYKQAVVDAAITDIITTDVVTGVPANFLRSTLIAAGLDPDKLPAADKSKMNFGSGGNMGHTAWRDIWGAGQSVAGIDSIQSVAEVVDQLEQDYHAAHAHLQSRFSNVSIEE